MRLLDVRSEKLTTFNKKVPEYAVLSHTWLSDGEEVTFAQIQSLEVEAYQDIPGYQKIRFLCEQAAKDGYDYAWIDTCCIDKTSSAELSEAINSMYAWYRDSDVCYAYLSDVDNEESQDFLSSRWWGRSWTLQEFLAPEEVVFYDKNGSLIGTKTDMSNRIALRTGIDEATIIEPGNMLKISVAQKMSWASRREATRREDIAYSLMGLFNINMPLLYGEGHKAFMRLQHEIMRTSNDQSLFAWGFIDGTLREVKDKEDPNDSGLLHDLLADSPRRFEHCGKIISHELYAQDMNISEQRGALHLETPLMNLPRKSPLAAIRARAHLAAMRAGDEAYVAFSRGTAVTSSSDVTTVERPIKNPKDYRIMIIPCEYIDRPRHMMGIMLHSWCSWLPDTKQLRFRRVGVRADVFTFLVPWSDAAEAKTQRFWIDPKEQVYRLPILFREARQHRSIVISSVLNPNRAQYRFIGVVPTTWTWSQVDLTLTLDNCPKEDQFKVTIGLFDRKRNDLLCVALDLGGSGDRVRLISQRPPSDHLQHTLEVVADRIEKDNLHGFRNDHETYTAGSVLVQAAVSSNTVFNQVTTYLHIKDIGNVEDSEDSEDNEDNADGSTTLRSPREKMRQFFSKNKKKA